MKPSGSFKTVLTPVISWIAGTILPWFESSLVWITGTISPVFNSIEKNEIIFWLQVTAFVISIVSGLVIIRNRVKNKKE